MDLADLEGNARNHYDMIAKYERREEWALSVNSIPDMNAAEIAKRAGKLNNKICVSTVGVIEALDCVKEVRSDWKENGHANIVFHEEPDWDDLEAVKSVFYGPVPNPGRSL